MPYKTQLINLSTWLKKTINIHSYWNYISLFLGVVFITALFSHVIFSVGLDYDGSHILTGMVFKNSFEFIETSRLFFDFLKELPAYLFIQFFPSDSLSLLTQVFSFGLVWIHIFSLIGCWLILPKDRKSFIFFPLFAFCCGPLIALEHSISTSLSAFSYVWFMAFVIYYSDLSLKMHKALLFLTPLPLFLSYELMSYASLLLIFLCLLKINNYQKTFANKAIITGLVVFFSMTFFVQCYLIFFPTSLVNRDNYLSDLLSLSFLYTSSNEKISIHACTVVVFILTVIPFVSSVRLRRAPLFLKRFFLTFLSISSLITNTVLLFPSFLYPLIPHYYLYPAVNNRIYSFCALPFTILLWFLFEKKIFQFEKQKLFLTLCLISAFSLIKWRVEMDYNFYKLQRQFSEKLERCQGQLKWSLVRDIFHNIEDDRFEEESLWKITSISLLYPHSQNVKAVLLNDDCIYGYGCGEVFEGVKDSVDACKEVCEGQRYHIPNSLFNGSFNSRFFNFQPLIDNISKNISTCNN